MNSRLCRGVTVEVETKNMTEERREKGKVIVILGATGSGKSRLAIDLASYFPIEIISADSMQVYQGLDVLTNKVPIHEQNGVPHHLLGTVNPGVEFTAKDFRDSAIPIIDDILSRNRLPVVVGGTNYYIQALMSPFLLDDSIEDMDETCCSDHGNNLTDFEFDPVKEYTSYSYDSLKELDPVAAYRIHPNDHRKITQYLNLYSRFGVIPSEFLQRTLKNWGQANNFRYNCCFICVDASLPVVDKYVEQRVDHMVDSGLLSEVYDIYNFNADYTRGLRQAIGVREFEDFLKAYSCEGQYGEEHYLSEVHQMSVKKDRHMLEENMESVMKSLEDNRLKVFLKDATNAMKVNTRRLVRRQKRRLNQLHSLFGWGIHYVDATDTISSSSDETWTADVVERSVRIISSFLNEDKSLPPDSKVQTRLEESKLLLRDLWTQHVCKACGDRVLRGAHEWEQHIQGRSHRKRMSRFKKTGSFGFVG